MTHKICGQCEGTKYMRFCRNSKQWRRFYRAPNKCPYGIPLNNLPVGDNMPDSPQSTQGTRGEPRVVIPSGGSLAARNLAVQQSIYAGPNPCPHLQVLPTGGCCDNELYCHQSGTRRKIEPGACRACAHNTREEPALIGAATHG